MHQIIYPQNKELRQNKDIKTQLRAQQNVFKKPSSKSCAVTASFEVNYVLAKKYKPFSYGEFIKETFLEMSD